MNEQNGQNEHKITKTYEASIDDVNTGKREVVAIISTDSIDRDKEVVQPKGLRDKVAAGKAVVMVNHDYQTLPIGKSLWVKAEEHRIIAKYRVSDKTQMANDVFGLLQDGTLDKHSIGFLSHYVSKPSTKEINARPDLEGARLIHRDFSLLEYSVVGIPANPDAITLAVSKGKASSDLLTFLGITKNVSKNIEGIETPTTEHEVIESVIDPKEVYGAFYETLIKRLKIV